MMQLMTPYVQPDWALITTEQLIIVDCSLFECCVQMENLRRALFFTKGVSRPAHVFSLMFKGQEANWLMYDPVPE